MVCQRMLREREEQVRVEFGKILEAKLAGKLCIRTFCLCVQ